MYQFISDLPKTRQSTAIVDIWKEHCYFWVHLYRNQTE